jgi:DNA-directed RNA polymerase specialized sigma24 family protein
MGEDDAKLIARVAGGDLGHPLEELYDRYAARLHGLGLRLLGDPGLAEELVQETFVRLWQSADRYCGAGRPPSRSPSSARSTAAPTRTLATSSTSCWSG